MDDIGNDLNNMTHAQATRIAIKIVLDKKYPEPACNEDNYLKCPGCSFMVRKVTKGILGAYKEGYADRRAGENKIEGGK